MAEVFADPSLEHQVLLRANVSSQTESVDRAMDCQEDRGRKGSSVKEIPRMSESPHPR